MEFNGYLGAVSTNAVAQDCVAREPQALYMHEPTPHMPRMREIKISALDRGFVVQVGCQSFAIQTKEDLIAKLVQYINDPMGTEEKYHKGEFFK